MQLQSLRWMVCICQGVRYCQEVARNGCQQIGMLEEWVEIRRMKSKYVLYRCIFSTHLSMQRKIDGLEKGLSQKVIINNIFYNITQTMFGPL